VGDVENTIRCGIMQRETQATVARPHPLTGGASLAADLPDHFPLSGYRRLDEAGSVRGDLWDHEQREEAVRGRGPDPGRIGRAGRTS
jgi:hypothetical protein